MKKGNGGVVGAVRSIAAPLAEQLGYKSYTTIQKWESDVSEPPIKKLQVLAHLFNVDINDLTNFSLQDDITLSDEECFSLQIKGNCMEPRICNGDTVIVHKQSFAEDGDIVIVSINQEDAICKRLKKYKEGIALLSNNPTYEPLYFSNTDIKENNVLIIGKVTELRAKF